MNQLGKRRRKARPETSAGLVMTRADWLWLSFALLGIGLVFFGWFALELRLNHETRLRQTLARWRAMYHLTEAQERQIRAEEERFHGTANPLTRPRRTPEESTAHEFAISHLMNPEDGARYLAAHTPPADRTTIQATSAVPDNSHP